MDPFIKIYKDWLAARAWAERYEMTAKQRTALAGADSVKKKAWLALPETRRREIIKELILQDLMPDSLLTAMNIFEARVVGI